MRSAESLATKHRGEKSSREVEIRQGTQVTDDPAERRTLGEPVNTAALAAAAAPPAGSAKRGQLIVRIPEGRT